MNMQKTRDALEDALKATIKRMAIDKSTGYDADALAASMALFVWDDIEPVFVEQTLPVKATDTVAAAVDSAVSDQPTSAPPLPIDWSQYGRGKAREQPNAEINFYAKAGELRIRADFPAHGTEEVAARINRQLEYWKRQL